MQQSHYQICFLQWGVVLATVFALFRVTSVAAASPTEIAEWLQVHNSYRTLHGVPSVIWSVAMAASAQAYAESCPSDHSASGYGENMAWASSSLDPALVVRMWYDEEPLYDDDNPGWTPAAGHFTQVVWKESTEIGCGVATDCGDDLPNVWVCQYSPPGNHRGRFAENVFPRNSDD